MNVEYHQWTNTKTMKLKYYNTNIGDSIIIIITHNMFRLNKKYRSVMYVRDIEILVNTCSSCIYVM